MEMLQKITLKNESELEALLIQDPGQIEEGFKVITSQRNKRNGRLDILGVDSEGAITVIELKVVTDPGQLTQALKYYDDLIKQGIVWYIRAFEPQKLEIKEIMPQIFLIAPDYDEQVKIQAKYLREDVRVRLFRYQAFDVNGKKEIALNELEVEEVSGIEVKPWSVEDNIAYIENKTAQESFKLALDKLSKLGPDIRLDPGFYVVKVWTAKGKLCELYPRKDYFNAGFKNEIGLQWESINRLTTPELVSALIDDRISGAYVLLSEG
jgi:hypothetical protein